MSNSDDFLVVAKTLVAKDQNSCSEVWLLRMAWFFFIFEAPINENEDEGEEREI